MAETQKKCWPHLIGPHETALTPSAEVSGLERFESQIIMYLLLGQEYYPHDCLFSLTFFCLFSQNIFMFINVYFLLQIRLHIICENTTYQIFNTLSSVYI